MATDLLKFIIEKLKVVLFSSVTVLTGVSACTLGNFGLNQQPGPVYGVLKRDLQIRPDGFVRANAVINIDQTTDNQGLSPLSVIKIQRVSREILFALTVEKGIFKTLNGGQTWQRQYLIPVGSNNQDQGSRNREINRQIAANDAIKITDFTVDPANPSLLYISASDADGIGKIYQSFDQGETFKEVYSEVEERVRVLFITINPVNSEQIFAILEQGALLRSLDGGISWSKVRSFRDTPLQIGFVQEFNNLFFVLFETDGPAISTDLGQSWELDKLIKTPSQIGENQGGTGFFTPDEQNQSFIKFEKLVPVTAGIFVNRLTGEISNPTGNKPWILVADGQMWYSQNMRDAFIKLVLPLQSETANIYDVAPDPNSGLNRILASVDNRLFITTNRGESWNTQDNINLSTPIGNISQILIEPENPEIIYLSLINQKYSRRRGILEIF